MQQQQPKNPPLVLPPDDDIMAFITEPFAVIKRVVGSFQPETVGILSAPGSTGKSFFALQLAFALAAGNQTKEGRIIQDAIAPIPLPDAPAQHVVYLSGEDPADQRRNRVKYISQRLSPVLPGENPDDPAVIALHEDERKQLAVDVKTHLHFIGTTGLITDLFDAQHLKTILDRVASLPEAPVLIIVDTFSRFHQSDENSNAEMAKFLGCSQQIATQTGAAMLKLHHTSKFAAYNGLGTEQQSARGASSIVDNSRWGGSLQTMTERQEMEFATRGADIHDRTDYICFNETKASYGKPIKNLWLKRTTGGVLVPANLPVDQPKKSSANAAATGSGNKNGGGTATGKKTAAKKKNANTGASHDREES